MSFPRCPVLAVRLPWPLAILWAWIVFTAWVLAVAVWLACETIRLVAARVRARRVR